jgi:hypothetical protein
MSQVLNRPYDETASCGCRIFGSGPTELLQPCPAHTKPAPCGCGMYGEGAESAWMPCAAHIENRAPSRSRRYYVRACVVEAERLPSGNWKVTGHGWLARGVEFSDEDFRRNFEAL